jgi:nucleotidyltransferase substrate binding protein (TIGR01987 family)
MSNDMTKIKLDNLRKAIKSLDELIQRTENKELLAKLDEITQDGLRSGAIQNFECAYELSKNVLRKVLSQEFEAQVDSAKDIYRLAGQYGIINDVDKWFYYHDARNNTSHRYAEDIADATYLAAKTFVADAKKLLKKLEEILQHANK